MGTDFAALRSDYAARVARGEGYVAWQARDRLGESAAERECRALLESRKDELLARRVPVAAPATLSAAQLDRARRTIASRDWAGRWYAELLAQADYLVAQPPAYVERMIPALTPTNPYGFSCPNCVGTRSQEGIGIGAIGWDYRDPEVISCRVCGQRLPDETRFPETGRLVCPRAGQTIAFYQTPAERVHPDDVTGQYAWKWVGKPAHVSFTGNVRHQKVRFMLGAARRLGLAYRFSGDRRYAALAVRLLERFTACVGQWLYHDFYDTMADCDPLYAAWHDRDLRLEWKRHASTMAYWGSHYETGPVDDQAEHAKMLATYFGCGRIHPSADAWVLEDLCRAYDLTSDATDETGQPLWTPARRRRVERDLLLEYLLGAEPYLGGPGRAECVNNKAPYVYRPMATAAVCLGLPDYAHVALLGFDALRRHSFLPDGFSRETPAYTDMYLANLLWIPETLAGFRWPAGFAGRAGVVDLYATEPALRQMLLTQLESLRPDGRYLPLSDTMELGAPALHVLEIGLRRYPDAFAGTLATLARGREPTEFALFDLAPEDWERPGGYHPPTRYFPDWGTAVLRHGRGPAASVLALALNPAGGHRHGDNLGVYYLDRGRTVLGEQGYVGDTPQIRWAHQTAAHNLVVVDEAAQQFWGQWGAAPGTPGTRTPSLELFVDAPRAAAVGGSSQCYAQCTIYRRTLVLLKGPNGATLVVDLFRVAGGQRHAWRVFSEVAASDQAHGRLTFDGLALAVPDTLPDYGKSIAPEHVSGLREPCVAERPPAAWRACWRQADRAYRLHVLSPADAVLATHGPGQETTLQAGRRVRYLDVVRTGAAGLASTFVMVHEPCLPAEATTVRRATRLALPAAAGAWAVGVELETAWGRYVMLSEVENEVATAGARFAGALGVLGEDAVGKPWLLAVGATTCEWRGLGWRAAPAAWESAVERVEGQTVTLTDVPPPGWPAPSGEAPATVLLGEPGRWLGYPLAARASRALTIARFPPPPAPRARLLATRWAEA